MKTNLFLAALIFTPTLTFAAAPGEPLIYQLMDAGVFVAIIIALYVISFILSIQALRAFKTGLVHQMLVWIAWGLAFGISFQSYIFLFDYHRIGNFNPANVNIAWHALFITTIVLILIGMIKVLRRE